MKKFKLIKKYPGSAELDTIVECKDPLGGIYSFYPEFWEEIKEPEWVILSIRSNISKHLYSYDASDGHYYNDVPTEKRLIKFPIDVMIAARHPDFTIISVKRLSDGEIFSIGDQVTTAAQLGQPVTITKLRVADDEIVVNGKDFQNNLRNIQKIKKKFAFITQDGVKLYDGDIYYSLTHKSEETFPTNIWKQNIDLKEEDYKWHEYRFSTKEAAEEFILLNKPCLSIMDVINAQDGHVTWTIATLKNLVKSRI